MLFFLSCFILIPRNIEPKFNCFPFSLELSFKILLSRYIEPHWISKYHWREGEGVNLFWNNETTLNIEIFVSPLFHSNWRCVQNILDAMHWFPILIFSCDWKWGSKDYRFEKFNPLLLPLIVISIGRGLSYLICEVLNALLNSQ